MVSNSCFRLIAILLLISERSMGNRHSSNRKIKRLHPKHLDRRTLTDYASTELEEVGNSLLTPSHPASKSKSSKSNHSKSSDSTSDYNSSTKSKSITKTYPSSDQDDDDASVKVEASVGIEIGSSSSSSAEEEETKVKKSDKGSGSSGYSPSKYHLKSESSGKTFFDAWDFFTDADPTHGLVSYQSSDSSWKSGLVSIGSNSLSSDSYLESGYKNISQYPLTARMKVDSTSWLGDGQNRKSVRLTSKARFKYGLLILDAVKMPYGCSTWPAFWTVGDNWPNEGEIDIVEGVNMIQKNQMTLHTSAGCMLKKPMGGFATGEVYGTNCDATVNGNAGCGVGDLNHESYGEGFNKAGGGIFAMEWKSSGITIWRFPRRLIPNDILDQTPNPSTWGHPVAFWSSNDCSGLKDQFGQHRIVFDITVCGDWAGSANVFGSTGCSGSCSEAIKDPTNFSNAEWEIASVQLYQ